MDIQEKIEILADAAKYDASCASSGSKRKTKKGMLGNSSNIGICHSYTPDGRCVSLLKILMTNNCIYDCHYCINRLTSNTKRATLSVDEIVQLTINFYKKNYIEGLFLSSGVIKSPDFTMDRLVQVARRLREDENYNGYIHLKAVPGASGEVLALASLWADRLSANIELPMQKDLDLLAPGKSHEQVYHTMADIKKCKDEGLHDLVPQKTVVNQLPAGQSTQMIVGATSSSDQKILFQAHKLYKTYDLKRVYYSAYSPIPKSHALLPIQSPPLVREHRLYQADWLLRFYQFSPNEIVNDDFPNLDLTKDPKLAWALRNRSFFPININTADKFELLRVPGIGVRNVLRILKARRFRNLTLIDLKSMRVQLNKAKFFITTKDRNPYSRFLDKENFTISESEQLSLFSENLSSLTGEV